MEICYGHPPRKGDSSQLLVRTRVGVCFVTRGGSVAVLWCLRSRWGESARSVLEIQSPQYKEPAFASRLIHDLGMIELQRRTRMVNLLVPKSCPVCTAETKEPLKIHFCEYNPRNGLARSFVFTCFIRIVVL